MEEILQNETTIPTEEPPVPQKKKPYLLLICLCAGVILAAAAAFVFTTNLRQYHRASKLYEAGEYLAADELFRELGDYKDAHERAIDASYVQARELMKDRQYQAAGEAFAQLGDYLDSTEQYRECCYLLGEAALEEENYDLAMEWFTKATDEYEDAAQKRQLALYRKGHSLFMQGQPEAAQECFDGLGGQWPEGGPHFETFDDAIAYIDTLVEQLPESITLVVRNMPGMYVLQPGYLTIEIQQHMGYQFADVHYDDSTGILSVVPSYYPGQRLVQAWKTGDRSKLDEAELETYEKALALVEQARAEDPDPEAMELWLHDWICQNTVYDSPYMYVSPEEFILLRELTCVGVILDGKANCQGYTDAFYVLATMAGLDVCKMFGEAEGGGHCWNAVRLDEWLYLVDVTFNDTVFGDGEYWSYIWYNNILDLDSYAVYGGTHLFYRVSSRRDLSQTYYTRTDSVYDSMSNAAFALLRQYRKNGAGVCHAVVQQPDLTEDDFYQAVTNNMTLAGVYSVRYDVFCYTYEGDTYLWVRWI